MSQTPATLEMLLINKNVCNMEQNLINFMHVHSHIFESLIWTSSPDDVNLLLSHEQQA